MTKIYDFGEEEGIAFIISEYVPGETLEEIIKKKKTLPLEEVLRLGKEISDILARIHNKGILHRDIKPSNIIIREDGQLKLTDFGLAQSFRIEKLTIEGEIIGTPAYMSPEQISGKAIDFRSDIFSLGVVLFELLTGENPFLAPTFTGVLHKILYEKTDLSGLPKEVRSLLSRMLAKDPNHRFSSAEEVNREIRLILKEPVSISLPQKALYLPWRNIIFLLLILIFFLISLHSFLVRRRNALSQIKVENSIPLEVIEQEKEEKSSPQLSLLPQEEKKGDKKREKKEEPPIPSSPRAKPDYGYLKIQVEPWADIYWENSYLGQTPFPFPIKLPIGRRKIKFSHPEFGVVEKEVEILPEETTHILFDFKTVLGGLKVIVEPWARIYLDGNDKGETPMSIIYLPPGRHELKVLNPNFPPYVETLEIKSGEIIERRIKW
ncbi:MAG: serine/threonine-protein kinase [candidate division WOR-3 bacterium]